MTGLPDPEPGHRWVIEAPPAEKRRGPWPWIIGIGIVVVVLVAVWFVAEWLARSFVTSTIQSTIISELGLPADQQIDVEIAGPVVPQLIAGTLSDVTVSSQDVVLGSFAGDVVISVQDVPIRGDADASGGTATVRVDEAQLRTLMSTVDGFPADSLGLDAPDVTMSTELSLFGVAFPIGVALQPSAVEGDLVLSPSALQVAGAEVTADALRDQFGGIADAVLRDWTVCVAAYIPAGVTLTSVSVDGDALTARFDLDPAIVQDPALQEPGSCG